MPALRALALAILCIACLPACRPEEGKAGAAGAPAGIERKSERGPVTVVLRTDKSEITIADRLRLTIEISAEDDYEVDLPAFGEKLDQFGIVEYSTISPRLTGTNVVVTGRTYTLEPFLSGDYVIPPMKISFRKKGEKEPVTHEIETPELKIAVRSLLPDEKAGLEIHDIAGPVEMPRSRTVPIAAAVVAAAILVVVAAVLAFRRRRRVESRSPPVPPHEAAFAALEKLIAEDLVKKGLVKAFYQGISAILRRYIEDRFGLRAPEQTTDEFLADLRSGNVLGGAHRELLEAFLRHCDLVKFAEHQPSVPEIQNVFDSAKRFIVESTPDGIGQRA